MDDAFSSRRIEPLTPEPGGVDAAWDEVRRRRRKRALRAQVAAGTALVAVVMVGLLPSLDETGRVAELDVAGRGAGRSVVETPASTSGGTGDSFAPPAASESAREGSPGRAPNSAIETPGAAEPRPGVQAPTPGRTKPAMERSRYSTLYVGCLDWCLSTQAIARGETFSLTLDLCVGVGARARRFSFPTTQEADMWVATDSPSGATLWTWSLGQQFTPHEHHVDIGPGECVTWETRWDATDEGGERLPAGTYRLFAKSLAEQVAPNSTTDTTFQIPE